MPSNEAVIKKAIDILSMVVNVSTGLAHPLDDARAKELFKALRAKGIVLEYEELYAEAIKHSWPERHAKKLAELGEKIGAGGRVQIKHSRDWGEPTVETIFEELGKLH